MYLKHQGPTMTTYSSHYLLIIFFITLSSSILIQAIVPASKTFKYVNNGEVGDYITEYDASYRIISIPNFQTSNFPFQLFFYNTTPNAYTFSLRMVPPRYEATMRWVWDANRGSPVRLNATLTFGADGNLVLADVDGRIAWQTGTANKGVVGIELLKSGNLVLVDSKGGFVWQSFNHPSDTLLVGQTLSSTGSNKIVSRVSPVDGSEGPYSFVLEKDSISLYLKSKNSRKPLLYYRYGEFSKIGYGQVSSITFNTKLEYDDGAAYDISYELYRNNSLVGSYDIARPKYNATYSILRIGFDGSLKVYTFYDKVSYRPWETTYDLFRRDDYYGPKECKLPTKCGSLGLCEDSQCIACPTPKGLLGWSKECSPPRLPPCKGGAKTNIDYFKVVGVEHFAGDFTPGSKGVKLADCRTRCTNDCGCLGFFYREESSTCFLAPELGPLNKVANQTHVAYIKFTK